MKERLSATVILCLILFSGLGCKETSHPEKSYEKEAKDTEENQQRLIRAVPPPKLQTSLERKNIVQWAKPIWLAKES